MQFIEIIMTRKTYSFSADMTIIKHTSTASVVESHLRLEIPPMDLIVSASEARGAGVGSEGLGKERSVIVMTRG